ncbi:hypothetical protein [Nonomuraea jiangxiensis]|uniref:hypothetical protein n=1 Tax=Nonomuraea jiangxiensis TaxID=633440 RepID=UPI001FE321EC|nr:hypothetical protein [Nonomuraea jiangxiensis]
MTARGWVGGALRPLLLELTDVLPPMPEPLDDRGAERHRVFRGLIEVLVEEARVHRDGGQLCDTPTFPTGFGPGSYRVAVDTTLSTRTSTEWSLNYTPDTQIPLVVTEYRLPVDLNNAVPARRHQAPIQLGYQRGGPAAPCTANTWKLGIYPLTPRCQVAQTVRRARVSQLKQEGGHCDGPQRSFTCHRHRSRPDGLGTGPGSGEERIPDDRMEPHRREGR